MQCEEFAQFLEHEPEGPLPVPATDHLVMCARCRLLLSDLEEIHVASMEWAAEEPAPSPQIWDRLRAQLESEGLIREQEPVRPLARGEWFHAWALRPAFAAAGLPVLLAAIALLHVPADFPGPAASDSIAPAVVSLLVPAPLAPSAGASLTGAPLAEAEGVDQTLDTDMRRVMASLPSRSPSLAKALQQNLTIVDNMIATCEKSAREQPDNPMVREYLYGAYQQKAVLLSAALERTTLEVR